jgi:hypothetical protein
MLAKLSEVCGSMVEVTDERRTTKVEKKKKRRKILLAAQSLLYET